MKKIMGQVQYLGPHVKALGLGYAKLYRDGVEPHLYEWFQRCPALREMFIPIANVAVVRRELNFDYAHNMCGTTGRYVTFYREVQKWLAQTTQDKPKPSGITMKQTTHA